MRQIKKKNIQWIFAIVGFLLSLYLVEASSFGSQAVATHNGGYGTFDMKRYDDKIVSEILSKTDSTCNNAYNRYYFVDFVFIIFFGLIQCMISNCVYQKNKPVYRKIAIAIPILRGLFDAIENVLLLITINSYPKTNNEMITVASISTQCKLWCIRIWIGVIFIGIIYNIIRKIYDSVVD